MHSLQIIRHNRRQLRLCSWLSIIALLAWLNFWIDLQTNLYQGLGSGGWDRVVLVALISLGVALILSFLGLMVYIKSWLAWIVFVLVLITTVLMAVFVIKFRWMI